MLRGNLSRRHQKIKYRGNPQWDKHDNGRQTFLYIGPLLFLFHSPLSSLRVCCLILMWVHVRVWDCRNWVCATRIINVLPWPLYCSVVIVSFAVSYVMHSDTLGQGVRSQPQYAWVLYGPGRLRTPCVCILNVSRNSFCCNSTRPFTWTTTYHTHIHTHTHGVVAGIS